MESHYGPHPSGGIQPGQHGGHPGQHTAGTFAPQEPYHYPETRSQTAPALPQNPPHPFAYPPYAQRAPNPYPYQSQVHATYHDPRFSYSEPQNFGSADGAPSYLPSHPPHGIQHPPPPPPPPPPHAAHQNPYASPSGYPIHERRAHFPNSAHQFENCTPQDHLGTTIPSSCPPPSTYAPNPVPYPSAREPVARGLVPPPGGRIPIVLGPDQTPGDAARIWFSLSDHEQCRVYNDWKLENGMDVDPTSTDKRKAKSKRKALNTSGGATTSVPPRRFAATCEDASDDEQPRQRNTSQGPSTGFADGVYPTAKGKERANGSGMGYSDPRAQHSSTPTGQPTGTPSETHFGVLVLDGLHRLETRMGQIENTFVRLTGQQPATGAGSTTGERSRTSLPRNAGRGRDESQGEDEDGDEDGDEDDEDDKDDDDDDEDEAQKRADKPHKTRLAKCIRFHMDTKLMKLKSIDKLASKFPPLTASQLAQYDAHDGPFVTADNYRPDFVQGWKRAAYNREVRLFTIDDFRAALNGGSYNDPPLPDRFRTRKRIARGVDGHMRHLRETYREQTHEQTPEFLLKQEKTRMRKRCNTRKHTTLRVRRSTIDRHDLGPLRTLYQKLDAEHMSGDEEVVAEKSNGARAGKQVHPRKYHIIDAAWQSRDFAKCSRTLDQWNIQDWGHSVSGRLPGGSGPRERIKLARPRTVNSAAPRGLWRNCYSKKWLDKQKPYARKQLKIIDEDFDFSLPTYSTPPDLDDEDFGTGDGNESADGEDAHMA